MKVAIGFSRPKGFFEPFSWLIRLFEWTPYSHVYIRSHSQSLDIDIIYQASGLQVNFVGLDNFEAKELIVDEFEIELPDDEHKKYMQWAVKTAGAPYGVKQVFGIVLVRLFNLKTNPFADSGEWVCAELAEFFLKNFAEISQLNPDDFETAGPKAIYGIVQKYGKKLSVNGGPI